MATGAWLIAVNSAGGDALLSEGDDGVMTSAESADTTTETVDVIMDEPVDDGLYLLSTHLQLITSCSFQLLRVEAKKMPLVLSPLLKD